MIDAAPDALEVGMPVAVRFWRISDEAAMPVFAPE